MELQVKLYNRYFKFNLEKTIGATVTQPQENTPHNVPTEAAQQAEVITQQFESLCLLQFRKEALKLTMLNVNPRVLLENMIYSMTL